MAKFVPDVKTQRWVVIAPGRVKRPDETGGSTVGPMREEAEKNGGKCVFCPGNESLNPLELYRLGGEAGDSNWQVRVIANKYPITDLHEVIVHSPDHEKDFDQLPSHQVELILKTYRARYLYHTQNQNGQVLIFNNHDVHAGASIKHPHSQLVVVPRQINLDTVPREPLNNLIEENDGFYVYSPDFSQWPYEVWIAPKKMGTNFGQIGDEEIVDLSGILQKMLRRLVKKFESPEAMRQHKDDPDFPYNFYIYHGDDWYLRIIPRLVHRAGFELGTGLSVNIIDPTKAAEELREN